jgi:hypothetical protein
MTWIVDDYSKKYREKIVKHYTRAPSFEVVTYDVENSIFKQSSYHADFILACARVLDLVAVDKNKYLVIIGTFNDVEMFKELINNDLPLWEQHPNQQFLSFMAMIISDEFEAYKRKNKKYQIEKKAKLPYIEKKMKEYFPEIRR